MAPYDFSREAYSRILWFTEGVANYSADMLLLRGKILNSTEYFVRATGEPGDAAAPGGPSCRQRRRCQLEHVDPW